MPAKRSAREKFLEDNTATAAVTPEVAPALARASDQVSATIMSTGDLMVSSGMTVVESILTSGHLVIGPLAAVENSVTARAGADVHEGVRIDGELNVTGTLRWGRGADVTSAVVMGPFVTGNSLVRATGLVAPNGIHSGLPASGAVVR